MKLTKQITNFFDWNLPISRKEGLLAMFVAFTPVMVASLVWSHQMISGAVPIPDPKDYVLPWYMYLAGLISVPVGWTIGFRRAKGNKTASLLDVSLDDCLGYWCLCANRLPWQDL